MSQPFLNSFHERSGYEKALSFARAAHAGQLRKYTNAPYWHHPDTVANIVSRVPNRTLDMIQAALLHDTIEDTSVTASDIRDAFGAGVEAIVLNLTDDDHDFGNRAVRKAATVARMRKAGWQTHTVKLADLMDNTSDIASLDPKFARTYLREASVLIGALDKGDTDLWNSVYHQIALARVKLNEASILQTASTVR